MKRQRNTSSFLKKCFFTYRYILQLSQVHKPRYLYNRFLLRINSCENISIATLSNEILEQSLGHVLGNEVVHRIIMFHQGCSDKNDTQFATHVVKETEYFSSFCSLYFIFKYLNDVSVIIIYRVQSAVKA